MGLRSLLASPWLLREYPDHLKLLALGIWGLVTLMPFTISFPIGGVIADELGWRYLFYLNIPFSLAIAGITGALLAGRGFEQNHTRFDGVGFVLLALIIGSMQTILNMGNDFDWLDSPFLRSVLISLDRSVALFYYLGVQRSHPTFNLHLFAHRNFTIGVIGISVGFLFHPGSTLFIYCPASSIAGLFFISGGYGFLAHDPACGTRDGGDARCCLKDSMLVCWSASIFLVLLLPFIGWVCSMIPAHTSKFFGRCCCSVFFWVHFLRH